MHFDLPAEDDPYRQEVRAWLQSHPLPTGQQMADAGYTVAHWPEPYGLDATPLEQLIIEDEFARAGVRRPGGIGIGWAAPTIYLAGTDEQKDTYLARTLSGELQWCQLFSEPDAGSDLAGLGTRAVRDGDEYIVNGSKIWSSGAHHTPFGILIARTDPDAPKHRGISYFICPMDLPGITMSPIVDMTGAHSFNQVFFEDVRIPANLLVGDENDGWRLAKVTLGNERASLSDSGSLWGAGPNADDLLDLVRSTGPVSDPHLRQRIAQIHIESEILRLARARSVSARIAGTDPGPVANIQKLLSDEHGQHVMELAHELVGAHGMLVGAGPPGELPPTKTSSPVENTIDPTRYPVVDTVWYFGFLFAPALTLGGGTWAVQRNIVAEMALGLPRDINVEKGTTWRESRTATAGVN